MHSTMHQHHEQLTKQSCPHQKFKIYTFRYQCGSANCASGNMLRRSSRRILLIGFGPVRIRGAVAGQPHTSWLSSEVLFESYGHDGPGLYLGDGQTEACLKNMGVTGLKTPWAIPKRKPEYRSAPPMYGPTPDLTLDRRH